SGLDMPEAFERIEALRNRIAQLGVPQAYGQLPVSATIGLAEIVPGESLSAAIRRAERALVEGKGAGGNRVVSAQPPTPASSGRAGTAPEAPAVALTDAADA
ncbi:MAG: hypothetical protein RLZZ592_2569, partial [Pseudomonadota bacterium]